MDVREKMIEILEEPCGGLYPACELADYLLSNGVTVDAVPVQHGHWIDSEDFQTACICSACDWRGHLYEDDVYGMPYCPNCGAKMDEVSE